MIMSTVAFATARQPQGKGVTIGTDGSRAGGGKYGSFMKWSPCVALLSSGMGYFRAVKPAFPPCAAKAIEFCQTEWMKLYILYAAVVYSYTESQQRRIMLL